MSFLDRVRLLSDRARLKAGFVGGRLRAKWIGFSRYGVDIDNATWIGPGCTVRCAPGGRIILRGASLGRDVVLGAAAGATLIVGDARLSRSVLVSARQSVRICDGVSIGDHVSIRDHDHVYSPGTGVARHEWTCASVEICENAWLGSHVVVTKGVTVGARSVAAAGAVVVRSVMPGTVVGGVPARMLSVKAR